MINQHPDNIDRREDFARWRAHVDRRLDEQDGLLREIRDMLGASKMGLNAIKWMIGIGSGVAAIWVALHQQIKP
jgi:hypothetical protein